MGKGKTFSVVGAMIPLSFLFGTSCSVPLQKAFGNAGPSYVAVVLLPFLLLYIIFFMPESRGCRSVEESAPPPIEEFTLKDKLMFLYRTDRSVIRVAAVAVALNTFGFSPVQEDLLTY